MVEIEEREIEWDERERVDGERDGERREKESSRIKSISCESDSEGGRGESFDAVVADKGA